MKKLSPKTIKAYSCTQLAKHLDRLMSKFNKPPFRVDLSYGTLYVLSMFESNYSRFCGINEYSRHHIIDAIDSAWLDLDAGATK